MGIPGYGAHKINAAMALGGVEADNPAALNFVRERHAFADGDYQRVRNQQIFVRGLIFAALSKETVLNPVKVSRAVSEISPTSVWMKTLMPRLPAGWPFLCALWTWAAWKCLLCQRWAWECPPTDSLLWSKMKLRSQK